MSLKDGPRSLVMWDEALLIAKTFTAAPAVAIFHPVRTPLIRVITGGGVGVV